MADQVETVAPATNGASTSVAAQRAATLAALEAGEHLGKPAAEAPAEKAAPEADAEDTEESEQVETPSDDDETETEAEESDDEDEAPVEEKPDPDISKRLAQVQKAERRIRETQAKQHAEHNAQVDARIAQFTREWEPRVKAAEEFEALKMRARREPDAVLEALGLTEDDFEPAARTLYARSKAGAADPKNREHAMRIQREREHADKLAANEKQIAELKADLAKRDQAAAFEQQKSQYLGEVVKTAGEDAPLLKSAFAKNPAKAHGALWALAEQHFDTHGEMPTAKAVVAAYEKARREELAELGIDVPAPAKAAKKVEAKKPDAKLAAKKPDGEAKTLKEQRAETLRKIEAGELD